MTRLGNANKSESHTRQAEFPADLDLARINWRGIDTLSDEEVTRAPAAVTRAWRMNFTSARKEGAESNASCSRI